MSIAILTAFLAHSTLAQEKEATPARINAAIDRGVARLLERYQDGEAAMPKAQPGPAPTEGNRAGMRALGLRAAADAGISIPSDVWADLARAVLLHQTGDGGFSYRADGATSSDTMTAAGVGVLAVCETQLARAGALDPDLAGKMRRARI